VVFEQFKSYGIFPHITSGASIGMWPEEQQLLHDLVKDDQVKDLDWLEIGTWNGGSFVLLNEIKRTYGFKGKIIGVDPAPSPYLELLFKRANVSEDNKFIKDYSDNIPNYAGAIFDTLGFVFIDGLHSFKQILVDFNAVRPYLADGAIVAFHDCSPHIQRAEYRKERLEWATGEGREYLEQTTHEDFFCDEAYCVIEEQFGLEHIDCQIECFHPNETRLNSWVRGKTSPSSSLAAMRYNGEG
jgi:cephalosporin hydroxylase